ncbi:MAG TPA: flagellar hook-length control protein FliK, partial [Methylocella sp.]|nr:flagellar hook-length control protein FliK [Methylocella sp.]
MNGIDGFSPSIMVDARVMLTGARSGDAAGPQADSGKAADFGGHLADLARQGDKASDPAGLASSPNRAVPAFVQQSFLLTAGTAEVTEHGISGPETTVGDARSTTASPQARGTILDGANDTVRSATGPGRIPATAPDPMMAGASPGVRNATLTERTWVLGADTSFANDGSSPTGHRPATKATRDSHARSGSDGAEAYVTSPLATGFPLLSAFPAVSEAKGGDSNETAASSNPALAGAASVSGAIGAMVSLGASPPFPDASRAAGRLPLEAAASAPVRVSIVDQRTHFAPFNKLSPAQQTALPLAGSGAVSVAGDAGGLTSSGESLPDAGKRAFDSALAQESAWPHASHAAELNGGHGPGPAASAPAKVSLAGPQAPLASPNGLSPALQIGELVASQVSPDNLDSSAITVPSSRAPGTSGMTGSGLSMSRVQTMQLQLDPESLGRVTISMRILGSRLDLRVETERPETMQLIGKEKDLLAGKLQAAGYSVESLIIRPAEPQASHQQIGLNAQSNGQDQSPGQSNGGASAHDRPSTQDDYRQSRPGLADDQKNSAGT